VRVLSGRGLADKNEYDNLLLTQLHGGCSTGTNAAVNREYCAVYNTWSAIYTLKTKMEERKLNGGGINF